MRGQPEYHDSWTDEHRKLTRQKEREGTPLPWEPGGCGLSLLGLSQAEILEISGPGQEKDRVTLRNLCNSL